AVPRNRCFRSWSRPDLSSRAPTSYRRSQRTGSAGNITRFLAMPMHGEGYQAPSIRSVTNGNCVSWFLAGDGLFRQIVDLLDQHFANEVFAQAHVEASAQARSE